LTDKKKWIELNTLNLIELPENVFVLSRYRSRIDEIANKLAQEWQTSGESLESMLTTLREIRDEYHEKKPENFSG